VKQNDEVEVIQTMEKGDRAYYQRFIGGKYARYHSVKVPRPIWEAYTSARTIYFDLRSDIDRIFKPPKDKLMHICKNHPEDHKCPYDE
jgi:hypothetical protein